jgi:hypothetical protein
MNNGIRERLNKHITTALTIFCFSFWFASCLVMCMAVIASWHGGANGMVTISFNTMHERLLETILMPLTTIGGIIISLKLLTRKGG